MGAQPATSQMPRQTIVVSLPLDLVSVLALLHRAVPDSHFDPWLIETRAALPQSLCDNLDLLHGFSGRRYTYPEEPAMRFRPLDPDRLDAPFETFVAFLLTVPPADYLDMAANAVRRAHVDLGLPPPRLDPADRESWRVALGPTLTTAALDDVLALLAEPPILKRRTIDLFVDFWDTGYAADYDQHLPQLREAARAATALVNGDVAETFAALTGGYPPAELEARRGEVRRVAYCPSAHLGNIVSYILFPPDLVVDFDAPSFLARVQTGDPAAAVPCEDLSEAQVLELARALADPNRLRILRYLSSGERYAQQIVGHLGIAQSAVSRHLAQMERAGLIAVSPRGGLKFYSVNAATLEALAGTFRARAETARRAGG